ncbi:hypothetical protein TEA_014971 [Camellia sinensis var. sinensis]|uniref:Expansin-like EG45 domain-containing protein n=1 Tax=Camellia sinensis var. sinensis TaxID=542762 RepID=A0A4S4DMX2_CAMSN|nr:hypothetical protein TEA_014971 [Camellia sinensis var. sinensis]
MFHCASNARVVALYVLPCLYTHCSSGQVVARVVCATLFAQQVISIRLSAHQVLVYKVEEMSLIEVLGDLWLFSVKFCGCLVLVTNNRVFALLMWFTALREQLSENEEVSTALCFKTKHFNLSTMEIRWSAAGATWYGSPTGAGSTGGACGYGDTVSQPPFSSMITAISPSLYRSGKECGVCYQEDHARPIQHILILVERHLVGAMANPGQEGKLRDAGVLPIEYARVACDYTGKTIAFHVDQGSNQNYFAVVVEFEGGDGDLAHVDLKKASNKTVDGWRMMQQSWGAVWKLDVGSTLKPPFSIRLTTQYSRQSLVASRVIPDNWQPGATYRSLVNYL